LKYLLILLSVIGFNLQAQTDSSSKTIMLDTVISTSDTLGYVELIVDSDIARMEASRTWERKAAVAAFLKNPGKVDGFRIMLGFNQNRLSAARLLNNANLKYGGSYVCLLEYDEPNFKVFMGEWINYNDAAKVVNVVRRSYPLARVIKDKIKAPPGYFDTDEDE